MSLWPSARPIFYWLEAYPFLRKANQSYLSACAKKVSIYSIALVATAIMTIP